MRLHAMPPTGWKMTRHWSWRRAAPTPASSARHWLAERPAAPPYRPQSEQRRFAGDPAHMPCNGFRRVTEEQRRCFPGLTPLLGRLQLLVHRPSLAHQSLQPVLCRCVLSATTGPEVCALPPTPPQSVTVQWVTVGDKLSITITLKDAASSGGTSKCDIPARQRQHDSPGMPVRNHHSLARKCIPQPLGAACPTSQRSAFNSKPS